MCGKEPSVLSETIGSVRIVTINRPELRNAVDYETAILLRDTLVSADKEAGIAAMILTGAGNKAFCSGQDLKSLAKGEKSALVEGGWGGITEHTFQKPLIAAVNGIAAGGGAELALCCDIAIAAEQAAFSLAEVCRGLFPVGGGIIRLARTMPKSIAMQMILTGEPISAAQALQYGLVLSVVKDEDLLPCALKLAETIAANAPLSVRYAKELFYSAQEISQQNAFILSNSIRRIIASSEDAKEGPAAFAQKRRPEWKGR